MVTNELIKTTAPAILAIIGTIFGVIITGFFNWLNRKSDYSNLKNLKKIDQEIEFRNNELIKPVLEFLEKELNLITKIYQKGFNKEVIIDDQLSDHTLSMTMIGARLKSLGNDILDKKFEEFTRLRISISFDALSEEGYKNINAAYENMKQAEAIASDIIREISIST